MANHKSAKKRSRSSQRKRTYNNLIKGQVKTLEKNFREFIAKKDKTKAESELKSLLVSLDQAAQKGYYHKNKSGRKKSKMIRLSQTLSS